MSKHTSAQSLPHSNDAQYVGVVARLKRLSSAAVSDCLGRQRGAIGLSAVHGTKKMAGRAFTVQTQPGDNLYVHLALELAAPGDVIVVDGGAAGSGALFGEIMMVYARARGIAGFVADGPIRDSQAFAAEEFPCYSRSINLRGPFKSGSGCVQQPVTVGGMEVFPGDFVLGDADGVVAIRPEEVDALLEAAHGLANKEASMLDSAAKGHFERPWLAELIRSHRAASQAPSAGAKAQVNR